jgi:hypothetical protein
MSNPWFDIVISQPTDGAQVWVRRTFLENPFLMYWHATEATFTTLPGDLVVSGAGDAAYNGNYLLIGQPATGPLYQNSTGAQYLGMAALNLIWGIGPSPSFNSALNRYTTPLYPGVTSTWVVSHGTAPAPTVTMSRVIPWYIISRWRVP